MIPYSYNMVDMGGIDLAEANGTIVDGLYAKIVEAVNSCGDVVLYNWKFAGIEIAPQYASILIGDPIIINGAVQVTEQDMVTVPGINPDTPVFVHLTAIENGMYRPVDYDADGFNLVEVDVPPTPPILQRLDATSNGTFYPPTGVDGYAPVVVNVPVGQANWRDSLSTNWDFAHPVNTRGSVSYRSSTMIYTIDGWQLQGGDLSFVTDGIKLEQYQSGTIGYFMQRFKSTATAAMVGKQCTLSVLVDGNLYTGTFVFSTAVGEQVRVDMMNDERCRIYRYSNAEIAVTIDITQDTGLHTIQAIKLETGDTQTLATQVNGVWVLNNAMYAETEYIKARNGTIYN